MSEHEAINMSAVHEISVTWNKPHHRSQELFNVPLNTVVKLILKIEARTSNSFYVVIQKPRSDWLHLSKTTGRVPFSIWITIDTAGLQEGQGYKEILEFRSRGELIYTEPVYLTTQVYDEQLLVQEPYVMPLNAAKPHRNPFLRLLNGILIIYHLGMTVVYLWIGLFIVCIVLAVIFAALAS